MNLKKGGLGCLGLIVVLGVIAAVSDDGDGGTPTADKPAATAAPAVDGSTAEPQAEEATEAPEPAEPVACAEVGPIVLAELASGLNAAGGSIARAAYVPATPPNSESGAQWYAVAAPLTGPGLDDTILTWVTSADLPADSAGGSWFSVDNLTKEFNVFPMPDAVADWARGSADPDNARGCVE